VHLHQLAAEKCASAVVNIYNGSGVKKYCKAERGPETITLSTLKLMAGAPSDGIRGLNNYKSSPG
jgi:hypothetical protein